MLGSVVVRELGLQSASLTSGRQIAEQRPWASCVRSIVVRTLVSTGELSLSCARLLAGWMTDHFVVKPSAIGQPT